jgi:hypothetical protein
VLALPTNPALPADLDPDPIVGRFALPGGAVFAVARFRLRQNAKQNKQIGKIGNATPDQNMICTVVIPAPVPPPEYTSSSSPPSTRMAPVLTKI